MKYFTVGEQVSDMAKHYNCDELTIYTATQMFAMEAKFFPVINWIKRRILWRTWGKMLDHMVPRAKKFLREYIL